MQKSSASLTQAERSALSDTAMLDAAKDLVLVHGTEKTTLAMIGESAGYSRGLATYRFGSKAGLYDALCKSISRDWLEYLKRGVGDKTGIDAMCAALDAIRQFVEDRPREGRVLQILYCDSAVRAPSSPRLRSGSISASVRMCRSGRSRGKSVARFVVTSIRAKLLRSMFHTSQE